MLRRIILALDQENPPLETDSLATRFTKRCPNQERCTYSFPSLSAFSFSKFPSSPIGTETTFSAQSGSGTRISPSTKQIPRRVRYSCRAVPAPLRYVSVGSISSPLFLQTVSLTRTRIAPFRHLPGGPADYRSPQPVHLTEKRPAEKGVKPRVVTKQTGAGSPQVVRYRVPNRRRQKAHRQKQGNRLRGLHKPIGEAAMKEHPQFKSG